MPAWIEIPAHRILQITGEEWRFDYETFGESGKPPQEGEKIYRVVRKADGKVFTIARFWPSDALVAETMYLEEL